MWWVPVRNLYSEFYRLFRLDIASTVHLAKCVWPDWLAPINALILTWGQFSPRGDGYAIGGFTPWHARVRWHDETPDFERQLQAGSVLKFRAATAAASIHDTWSVNSNLLRKGFEQPKRVRDRYRVKLVVITNTSTYKTLAATKILVSRARSGILCPFCALGRGFCALECALRGDRRHPRRSNPTQHSPRRSRKEG
jgi:hypothetical protein